MWVALGASRSLVWVTFGDFSKPRRSAASKDSIYAPERFNFQHKWGHFPQESYICLCDSACSLKSINLRKHSNGYAVPSETFILLTAFMNPLSTYQVEATNMPHTAGDKSIRALIPLLLHSLSYSHHLLIRLRIYIRQFMLPMSMIIQSYCSYQSKKFQRVLHSCSKSTTCFCYSIWFLSPL